MIERNISEESILEIVNGEADCVVYPSTRDEDLDLFFGRSEGRYLPVVVNRETGTLVTVRAVRKKEKQIFEEVMKSDG